ncbi:MAG: hypothetical protein C0515_10655 [Novosphingobium sp.]|nr:hypothetical protein [Novosphingobium sp.]
MMGLILLFFLGMGNFAMHKAVLESHHPLLERVPLFYNLLGGRFSLLVEFVMLLGAMLMVAQGSLGWALFYGVYTAFNALSAWLIMSGRI